MQSFACSGMNDVGMAPRDVWDTNLVYQNSFWFYYLEILFALGFHDVEEEEEMYEDPRALPDLVDDDVPELEEIN